MPLIPWPANLDKNKQKEISHWQDQLSSRFSELPTGVLALGAFALGSTLSYGGVACYRRYFKRIKNGDWVTPNQMDKKRWIKGYVTSVGDSDNFRLYHTPGPGWRWPLKFRRVPSLAKELKDQTLHIRIAGVDAPEAAHFGRPSQPYSKEALDWLQSRILGKTLYCQLVQRDQYSRFVSIVALPPRLLPGGIFTGKSLSLEMLKAGWGTTYEQAGAVYGKWGKDEFLRVEAEAKAARRGQWASGLNAETPAEYKRRYAESASLAEAQAKFDRRESDMQAQEKPRGWFSWFRRK